VREGGDGLKNRVRGKSQHRRAARRGEGSIGRASRIGRISSRGEGKSQTLDAEYAKGGREVLERGGRERYSPSGRERGSGSSWKQKMRMG